MLVFVILLIHVILCGYTAGSIGSSTDPALLIRNALMDITTNYPQAQPQCIANQFVGFITTHGLSDNTELENAEDLADHVSIGHETANLDDIIDIWPFYLRHIAYMKKIRSRNSLAYYLHNNPVSSTLDRAGLLRDFFEAFNPSRDDVSSLKQFVEFMRGFDAIADFASLRKIYPAVFNYQQYLDRRPTRVNLKSEIVRGTALNLIAPKFRSFITSYGLVQHDISKLKTFRSLLYDLDYSATDDDSEKIHSLVSRFSFITSKAASRIKLLRKLEIGITNVYDMQNELSELMTTYNLVDEELSDLDKFKRDMMAQDYHATEEMLTTIHGYVFTYVKYLYMKQVTELALDFLERNTEFSMIELSNYLDPFIAVFNLLDLAPQDATQLRNHIRPLIKRFTMPQATKMFTHYAEYVEYLRYVEPRDTVVHLIKRKPNVDIPTLDPLMHRLYTMYELENKDVSDIEKLRLVLIQRDKQVSDSDISTLFPFLTIYIQFINRKNAFETLISRLTPSTASQSSQASSGQAATLTTTPKTTDELLDKVIEVFKLKKSHFSFYSEFYKHIKASYYSVRDVDIRVVFDNVVLYHKYKELTESPNKFKPGDVKPDGSIVPPKSEDQLFWYNFFKGMGGEPHLVKKVQKFEELIFFKRWFDAVYKYLTKIPYYVTPDRLQSKTSPSRREPSPPRVEVARSQTR